MQEQQRIRLDRDTGIIANADTTEIYEVRHDESQDLGVKKSLPLTVCAVEFTSNGSRKIAECRGETISIKGHNRREKRIDVNSKVTDMAFFTERDCLYLAVVSEGELSIANVGTNSSDTPSMQPYASNLSQIAFMSILGKRNQLYYALRNREIVRSEYQGRGEATRSSIAKAEKEITAFNSYQLGSKRYLVIGHSDGNYVVRSISPKRAKGFDLSNYQISDPGDVTAICHIEGHKLYLGTSHGKVIYADLKSDHGYELNHKGHFLRANFGGVRALGYNPSTHQLEVVTPRSFETLDCQSGNVLDLQILE